MKKIARSLFAVVCLVVPDLVNAQAPTAKDLEFFENKIRPVLTKHCYSCHSAEAEQSKKLQARLYLDSAEGTLTGGESGAAIVKGKPAESLLVKAMKYDGLEMPPSGKLPAEVIADFEKWIESGAADPRQGSAPAGKKREINIAEGREFWSFQPLKNPAPPAVKNTAWSRTPVDRFVLAAQEEKGLKANPLANAEKLIRRVYFDLIGLPPTPAEVEAFVQAASNPSSFDAAYSALVDRLLKDPRYGERWARHWLDVARYAESGGYEFDGFRNGAYHYRDWVIRALNDDMPYDEFVRMQIAGDKLSPDDIYGASAAGFLVAGPYPGQITAKTVERIRYDQIDDMIMTIGGSMMGLTLGCVRCHEHKYDPIPQADYYGIAAALGRTVQGTKTFDLDPDATAKAIEKHAADREPLAAAIAKFSQEELPKRFAMWQKDQLPKQPEAPRWQVFDPVSVEAERSWLKVLDKGVIAHDGNFTTTASGKRRGRQVQAAEEYRFVTHTYQKNINSLRLDAFTDKSLPKRGPGLGADGSFQLIDLKVTAKPLVMAASTAAAKDAEKGKEPAAEKPIALKLKPIFAAFEDKDQPLANAVDDKPNTAWVVKTTAGKDNAAIFEIDGGLAGFASGTELTFELKFRDVGLGRVRLSLSTEPNPATWAGDFIPQHLNEIRAILAANKNQLPDSLREATVRWFRAFDADAAKVFNALREHDQREPRPTLSEVYTTAAGGGDVFLLRRGEVDNKQGKADPGFIQVLFRTEDPKARWLTTGGDKPTPVEPRLALANWLTDTEAGAGHLVARVIVNRLWQHHFGEGIVGTPNDFGAQGDRPSHPELLDWLASELVRGGWKLKSLHKLLMNSAAYMQDSEVSVANQKIDPENRFFWHHRPRRLEAEVIRDALLAVGGTLDEKMYGPSVLDNTARRSVYLRVKRSELIPFMTMFDAPEPTQSIGERSSTTVPTQALAMMNSQFVRQQSEKLAARIRVSKDASVEEMIDLAYRTTFARLPSAMEKAKMLAFIDSQKTMMGNTTPAIQDKALAEFCHVLLCLNEFVYVD